MYEFQKIVLLKNIEYNFNTVFFFFESKFVIMELINKEWIRDLFVFVTDCLWKILRIPGLQANEVI
jgi:hypothetical protein